MSLGILRQRFLPFKHQRPCPTSHPRLRQPLHRKQLSIRVQNKNSEPQYEFGYSRKDILLLGGGIIGLGYGLYYGVQALGVDSATAGNYVQLGIFLVICVGYSLTYIRRVATKSMTYAQQLKKYEEDVMQKRLEELAPEELEKFLDSVERDRQKIAESEDVKQ
eukprot:TRINITY_DN44840_c0_g1_i1.p2 TRINITY_DN44840_c0_g1~~TRINITY_DN44840_c0_g1_i1.p2  ORF type:complete len:163 (-),score=20.20 TRINITY_DN44840_c0_g1_i1:221-709(-)